MSEQTELLQKIHDMEMDLLLLKERVSELETETSERQGWLDPIKSKIDFVENADKTGDDYFDRFHSINEYIWEGAQMSSFSINSGGGVAGGMGGMMDPGMMAPGMMRPDMMGPGAAQPTGGTASTVEFTVEVHGDAGGALKVY